MKMLYLLFALLLGIPASAQTSSLFIATDPPQTYCAVTGKTVTLTTTWWDGEQLSAKDTLSLPPIKSHNWQCTGNYTASVSWMNPDGTSCQSIAIAQNDIAVTCNGNSCSPNDKATDYTIHWNNPSCAN